jgi:hypothetical protein
MGVKKTGDWEKARALLTGLKEEIDIACDQTLMQIGLKGEAIVKGHISNQDLPWRKLSSRHKANKIRKGQSEKIYVATSTYFQSITSWYESKKAAYIGVKRGIMHKDGDGNSVEVANIGAVLEYGSRSGRIKPRPLWRPSRKELLIWAKRSDVLKNNINKRLAKFRK